MMPARPSLVLAGWLVIFSTCLYAEEPIQPVEPKLDREVEFYRDIFPILENKCLACHSAAVKEGDLILESAESVVKGGGSGAAVVPGKPDESLIYLQAARIQESFMPPLPNKVAAKPLTPQEVGLLRQWILEGAKAGERPVSASAIAWQPIPETYPAVFSLALSPNRRFIAAGRGNRIFVYDLVTGSELTRLTDPSLLSVQQESKSLYGPGVAHRDFVHALAFSPDGKYLASGGYRVVKLWQREEPAAAGTITTDLAPRAMSVHPDGTRAAILLEDSSVRLWNPSTGQAGATIAAGDSPVKSLAFSPDGESLLTGDEAGHVHVYKTADGTQVAQLATPNAVSALTVAARPNGFELITGQGDNKVLRWKWPIEQNQGAEPPKPIGEMSGHAGPVTSLVVLSSGNEILSGSTDGTVRIWNLENNSQVFSQNTGAPVSGVSVSLDGQTIAACGENGIARVWSRDGKQKCEVKGNSILDGRVAALTEDQAVAKSRLSLADQARQQAEKDLKDREESLKKSNEQLATAEKELAEAQKKLDEAKAKAEEAAKKLAEKRDDDGLKKAREAADKEVEKATGERDKKQEAVASAKRGIEISEQSVALGKTRLEERTKAKSAEEAAVKAVEELLAAANEAAGKGVVPMRGVALSADGNILTTSGDDGLIQQWSASDGSSLNAFAAHSGGAKGLQSTGAVLVTIGADKRAVAWDTSPRWRLATVIGGKPEDPLDVSASPFADRVLCLAFSPDSKLLATGGGEPSRSGELMLWNVEKAERVRTFADAHSDTVYDVEFSRDGKQLLSGAADKFVKLFDVASGALVRSYEGHTGHVLGVAFQADGSSLASAGADNAIKVWNSETGEQRRTINNYSKQVTCIDFVGISENLISGSGDFNVKFHRASNGQNFRSFGGSKDYIYAALAAGDESLVIAAGEEGVVRVWNGKDGKILREFVPPAPVETAAK